MKPTHLDLIGNPIVRDPATQIGARDRLVLDLRRAGFTVTPARFARSMTSSTPDIFTYEIGDASTDRAVTSMIVEVAPSGSIRIFLGVEDAKIGAIIATLYDRASASEVAA